MKLIKLIPMIGILILLTACTTECPKVNCPECNCPETEIIEDYLYVYFIDVGQGDAILIKHQSYEMLIDCGKNGKGPDIVDFLKEKGVNKLEYLMITHPDSDHLGGCDDVLDKINTQTVIMNGEEKHTNSYDEVIEQIDTEQLIIAQENNEWDIGLAKIAILQANNNFKDSNQNSIVSRLTYGNTSILLTGDCDRDCEDLLLNKNIVSTILKVPHHGSKFGTEIDFLEKVNPKIAVIQVGQNNYGHPSKETLDRLSQESIVVYRNDYNGDITIKIDENNYYVETET